MESKPDGTYMRVTSDAAAAERRRGNDVRVSLRLQTMDVGKHEHPRTHDSTRLTPTSPVMALGCGRQFADISSSSSSISLCRILAIARDTDDFTSVRVRSP